MDYFQSIVAEWLTSDGRTLIAEEYGLRTSHVRSFKVKGQTNLWPDILAVRLRDKCVFLCEVTWQSGWKKITEKMNCYAELMPSIREALDFWLGIPQTEDWSVAVWYFVPEQHASRVASLAPANLPVRVTKLEDIKPWSYTHGWRPAGDIVVEP